jgi:hypothetical protein
VAPEEDKVCARCGRRIAWRKKWARSWAEIRYCSDGCRKLRSSAVDRQLEEAIRAMVGTSRGGGVDPSAAARAVGGEGWRDLVEPARQAARRMVAAGEMVIVQGGHVVDPSTAKGEFRVRLR